MQQKFRPVSVLCAIVLAAYCLTLGTIPARATQESPASSVPATGEAPQVQMGLRGDGQDDGVRIDAEIEAGGTLDSRVFVGNYGTDPIDVIIYTADVGTLANGGLKLANADSEQHEPTTWLTFPTETITLAPQTERAKDFVVTVPADASPGEYAVAFAMETAEAIPVPGAPQLKQKLRRILPMYITVPGQVSADFTFGDPAFTSDLGPTIQIPLSNLGQTILRLTGDIEITNESGATVLETSLALSVVYGKSDTFILLPLSAPLPVGDYEVSLTMTDTESNISRGFDDVTMIVSDAGTPEPAPLSFENVLIGANAPTIQFVGVAVDIVNNGSVIRSARLTLIVEKNGEKLEDFVLADNLTLNQGSTTVSQRYIPIDGWETGSTYTFSLKLEAIDSGSGGASLLLESDDITSIEA